MSVSEPTYRQSMTLDQIQIEDILDSLQELTAAVKELVTIARQFVGPELPEECQTHTCTYYTHYLVYGSPDLSHAGFHEAERQALAHISSCSRSARGEICHLCLRWENRVRA